MSLVWLCSLTDQKRVICVTDNIMKMIVRKPFNDALRIRITHANSNKSIYKKIRKGKVYLKAAGHKKKQVFVVTARSVVMAPFAATRSLTAAPPANLIIFGSFSNIFITV